MAWVKSAMAVCVVKKKTQSLSASKSFNEEVDKFCEAISDDLRALRENNAKT